jgi:outer membrane lipoprotein LolB
VYGAVIGRRSALLLGIAICAGFTTACATRNRATGPGAEQAPSWRGRLALRVQADPASGQAQEQSFSAAFELSGSADRGELLFFTPLGSTAAAIHWLPGRAVLQSKGETREFEDLSQLIQQLLGTDVPVAALFSWLAGREQEANGWQVDLSQKAQGKILARRLSPAPSAELRVLLED